MTTRVVSRLRSQAVAHGFDASSHQGVGQLLRALAASKPGGRILELGTGLGIGTAYLLSGMDGDSRLVTIELDEELSAVARSELDDPRVEWVVGDAGAWLEAGVPAAGAFDLVFADTWPGKFTHLDQALSLVAPGGFYLVDDLIPQPNWPAGHQANVDALVERLRAEPGWATSYIEWASGVMLCTRTSLQPDRDGIAGRSS